MHRKGNGCSRCVGAFLAVLLGFGLSFGSERPPGLQNRIGQIFEQSAKLDSNQIYLVNNGSASVPFSLQRADSEATWQPFAFAPQQAQIFERVTAIWLRTLKASGDTCNIRYQLEPPARYSIYWNGECWDVIKVTK